MSQMIYMVCVWNREDGGEVFAESFNIKDDAIECFDGIDVSREYERSDSGYVHASIWSEDEDGNIIEEIADRYAEVGELGEMVLR